MRRAVLFSVLLMVGAWATPALADDPPPLPAEPMQPDPPTVIVAEPKTAPASAWTPAAAPKEQQPPEGPPRFDLIRVNTGFRFNYVTSRAFDQFADSDVLFQWSLDGTYPVFHRGRLVLGAGLGWDFGARGETLRGFESQVVVHRLYVPLEGRYHVLPGLALFGKLSPGALIALSKVKDPSAPDPLTGTGAAFAADLSVGANILLGPREKMDVRQPRFFLTPEIGYTLTTKAPAHLNPGRAEDDLLGSDEDTNLRSVAFSGVFWKLTAGLAF